MNGHIYRIKSALATLQTSHHLQPADKNSSVSEFSLAKTYHRECREVRLFATTPTLMNKTLGSQFVNVGVVFTDNGRAVVPANVGLFFSQKNGENQTISSSFPRSQLCKKLDLPNPFQFQFFFP